MKILLHICCAPCAIYPIDRLRDAGHTVIGFFYRHNIHPYTECLRREETLRNYADKIGLKVIYQQGYELEDFLRKMVFREEDRCRICYHDRLSAAAGLARTGHFDYFSTTLLYSKFQKHALIAGVGDSAGKSVGVPFHYEDFRTGWKIGVETSKQLGMYRQQYCGCIYSEKDRYFQSRHRTAG